MPASYLTLFIFCVSEHVATAYIERSEENLGGRSSSSTLFFRAALLLSVSVLRIPGYLLSELLGNPLTIGALAYSVTASWFWGSELVDFYSRLNSTQQSHSRGQLSRAGSLLSPSGNKRLNSDNQTGSQVPLPPECWHSKACATKSGCFESF